MTYRKGTVFCFIWAKISTIYKKELYKVVSGMNAYLLIYYLLLDSLLEKYFSNRKPHRMLTLGNKLQHSALKMKRKKRFSHSHQRLNEHFL